MELGTCEMVSTILFAGNKYLSSLPKVYLFSMQSRPVDHHLHSVREGLRVPTFSVPVTTCRGRFGTRAVRHNIRSRLLARNDPLLDESDYLRFHTILIYFYKDRRWPKWVPSPRKRKSFVDSLSCYYKSSMFGWARICCPVVCVASIMPQVWNCLLTAVTELK